MQNSDVESTKFPRKMSMVIRDKLIDFSTPLVMGIINCTPDSFYSGSRSLSTDEILARIKDMLNSGADILDIGGYSSRPGAEEVSIDEETERVIPVISAIRKQFPEVIISLDTFRSQVAEEGLKNGADLINDISGFSIDPELVDVVAKYKAPYVLMHMRGTPQTMQEFTKYDNLYKEILLYFSEKIDYLTKKGVRDILIDPGFGFSKTVEQNHELLHCLEHFQVLDKPILLGISRKSMIYKKLGITAKESLPGTIALNAIGLSKGASVLRVHDVKEAVDLVRLIC